MHPLWRQFAVALLGLIAHSAWELTQARGPRERRARLAAVAFLWLTSVAGFALGYGWRVATGDRVPTWVVVAVLLLGLAVWFWLWGRTKGAREEDARGETQTGRVLHTPRQSG
jgi:hypothetical protein